MASTDAEETVRYTMRTNAAQDGIWRRAKCLVHADCRLYGKMVQPSGRRVDLKSKTGDIKDLNANFVKHLEKRDKADGTSHADTWRRGLNDCLAGPLNGHSTRQAEGGCACPGSVSCPDNDRHGSVSCPVALRQRPAHLV
jgi:hypothetical protein